MKNTLLGFFLMISYEMMGQQIPITYSLTDILFQMESDAQLLEQLKQFHGEPVVVDHQPLYCGLPKSLLIMFQKDQVWRVDSCVQTSPHNYLTWVSSNTIFLKSLPANMFWEVGDTSAKVYLVFTKKNGQCFITPVVSRYWKEAYPINYIQKE